MTLIEARGSDTSVKLGIIDTDFHPMPLPWDDQVAQHLPKKWLDYISKYGMGSTGGGGTVAQREFTHRLDAVDQNGRVGVDASLAVEQVLDEFDMSWAVLTSPQAYIVTRGGSNMPNAMADAIFRAYNNALAEYWCGTDERFRASVSLGRDLPNAAKEIIRCKEEYGDRFVQVLISPAGDEPLGRQKYWPIFEACEGYDIPLAFHVPGGGRFPSGAGHQNFYGEMHSSFGVLPLSLVPSLIFEGVFDAFPKLKIALLELGWDWAVPFSWRLDAVHEKLRDEVGHIQRKPSEYLRDHFWWSTQPIEEPEKPEYTEDVYRMLEESGLGSRLMFSSDYPHWDFDSPYESVPEHFPIERRRRILGENASALYKLPLREGHGIPAFKGN